MKKKKRIFLIIIMSLIFIVNSFTFVNAAKQKVDTGGSHINKNYSKEDRYSNSTIDESTSTIPTTINPDDYNPGDIGVLSVDYLNISNAIIGAFQAIGSIVSVLALVIIGIKYMLGSIEERAEYKQTMVNYIIGAILVFAISNISAMIYNFASTL